MNGNDMNLEKFVVYAGEVEPVCYLSSDYELHAYLKMPFENENGSGTIHIDEGFSVYLQMDGEDCRYAHGDYLSNAEISERIVQEVCDQLDFTKEQLSNVIYHYDLLQSHIMEAAEAGEHIRKLERPKVLQLYDKVRDISDPLYMKKEVVEYLYLVGKEFESDISSAVMREDRDRFTVAVAMQNFGSFLANRADEFFSDKTMISNHDIKTFLEGIREEDIEDFHRRVEICTERKDSRTLHKLQIENETISKCMDNLLAEDIDRDFPNSEMVAALSADKIGNAQLVLTTPNIKNRSFTLGIGSNDKPYVYISQVSDQGKESITKFINKVSDISNRVPNAMKQILCEHMDFPLVSVQYHITENKFDKLDEILHDENFLEDFDNMMLIATLTDVNHKEEDLRIYLDKRDAQFLIVPESDSEEYENFVVHNASDIEKMIDNIKKDMEESKPIGIHAKMDNQKKNEGHELA